MIENPLGELFNAVFDARDTLEPEELSAVISVELPYQGVGPESPCGVGRRLVDQHRLGFPNTGLETASSPRPRWVHLVRGHFSNLDEDTMTHNGIL